MVATENQSESVAHSGKGADAQKGAQLILDTEPNEIFKRMVINDKKQNKRLSASLSKSSNGLSKSSGKDSTKTNMRFIVCALGLFSLSISQMSRMILNQTIKDMVHPSMHKKGTPLVDVSGPDGSCPWPSEPISPSELPESTTSFDPILYLMTSDPPTKVYNWPPPEDPVVDFINDDSDDKPDSEFEPDSAITDPLKTPASSLQSGPVEDASAETIFEDKFYWDMKKQSILLGGFFYGYAFCMIPGGRLAELYGAKYIILLSILGSGIINMATPWMARNSFPLLVASRVAMGVIQSGVFPAMYALFAKWLTATETSLFAPLIKLNLRLGMFFGSILPGILPDWPGVYYFTGTVSVAISCLWFLVATSSPEGNSWVSESELTHIMRKKRKPNQTDEIELTTRSVNSDQQSKQIPVKIKTQEEPTPWGQILTNPSVIGLILVKVTFNYAVDFFSILVPSYLSYVHHASKETVSLITTTMFLIQIVLMVFIGWLAKVMIAKKPFGLSKTAIRKIFQAVSNWGMAISLILLTFNDCKIMLVASLLQLMSLLSMFTAGGETMLPYDLSDQYPATIMAIANSIANFSGVTTTTLAGLILGGQSGSYDRWNLLMYLIAGANLLGGLAFVVLVKAEPIKFKSSRRQDIEQQPNLRSSDGPVAGPKAKQTADERKANEQDDESLGSISGNSSTVQVDAVK